MGIGFIPRHAVILAQFASLFRPFAQARYLPDYASTMQFGVAFGIRPNEFFLLHHPFWRPLLYWAVIGMDILREIGLRSSPH